MKLYDAIAEPIIVTAARSWLPAVLVAAAVVAAAVILLVIRRKNRK